MSEASTFIYVTYIYTTPEKLWAALTTPAFIKQYWMGIDAESDFQAGSSWRLKHADGRVFDSGEILEADPPRRLVIKWRHELMPELNAEGWARCVMELEPDDHGAVKLTVTHTLDQPKPNSKFIKAVSGGWPHILSNLKTMLEMKTAV